jgi:hypothetical protein
MAAPEGFSVARVGRVAAWAVGVLAAGLALLGRWESAVSLTASGGVAIINLRWLDGVVERVIQPGRPRFERGTMRKLALRMGLLGAVVVAIVLVRSVDAVAVAAGFTVPVAVLLAEGVRSAREGEG